jgi:hypothetical protein
MMNTNDNTRVFYQPGRAGIIDLAIERDGILTGAYSGESLEQTRIRYPGAEIGKLGPISEASEERFKHPPTEINEARFMEMLEVLPPVNWICDGESESFKLSERTYGNITAIFVRIEARYFELSDSIFLNHEQIIAKCQDGRQA